MNFVRTYVTPASQLLVRRTAFSGELRFQLSVESHPAQQEAGGLARVVSPHPFFFHFRRLVLAASLARLSDPGPIDGLELNARLLGRPHLTAAQNFSYGADLARGDSDAA